LSSTQVRHFITSLKNEKVREFDGKLRKFVISTENWESSSSQLIFWESSSLPGAHVGSELGWLHKSRMSRMRLLAIAQSRVEKSTSCYCEYTVLNLKLPGLKGSQPGLEEPRWHCPCRVTDLGV
jgi:hypothetical protein